MKNRRLIAVVIGVLCAIVVIGAAQQSGIAPQNRKGGAAAITPSTLREWLTYLSSDDLEGRDTFSEGLGLAAAYISDQLKTGGVRPGGDHGTYFQRVSVLGVRSTSHSTLTVEVNGITRTFPDGEGVTFPKNVGGKRVLSLDDIEFVGYGINLGSDYNDYRGIDVKGKAVVWLGSRGPKSADPQQVGRLIRSRASIATEEMGAVASIAPPDSFGGGRNQGGDRGGRLTPDFTTTQRLDLPQTPNLTATDDFLEFLFSGSTLKYADLKAKSDRQEDLPVFALKGVKLTFNLDASYEVVDTQYTRNIVGIVDGVDPQLKSTYVAFGGHYDHVGYDRGPLSPGSSDRIYNGADDDGSGSSTLIGLARSFAIGPRTKRSELFVWHAGEEKGLYGSKYFADYPTVPLDKIVAQLNIDMIGRNHDNNESEANTVYTVGSDRISSELHNVMIDANNSLPMPLTLNLEMNDPTDPERIYYRSDHFSYAAKGIPIIFFFTGLHPDYHQVTDSVEKIDFEKMARIGQLVFEIGRRLATLDHAPARDFKGPRLGKGASGKLSLNP